MVLSEQSSARRNLYKYQAIWASVCFGFPSGNLTVIGITGSKGKTTTAGIIHHLLQENGHKAGVICADYFQVGEKRFKNTTGDFRPWEIQKMLRKMCSAKCEYAIVEVPSKAFDQNRFWGVNFDTAVLTNIDPDMHGEYHGNSAEYIRVKSELFRQINHGTRKPNIPKMAILNSDCHYHDIFAEIPADKRWTYSVKKSSDFHAENLVFTEKGIEFSLTLPNDHLEIKTKMVGKHNLENILAALAAVIPLGVEVSRIPIHLSQLHGMPGRLETIDEGQRFGCVVDRSYDPQTLQATLEALRRITSNRFVVIWGGKSPIDQEIYQHCATHLKRYADEVVLTTDDPGNADPKIISREVRHDLDLEEGNGFFEIEDRYEAIRYALYCAEEGDLVLIAGRGDEPYQRIGNQRIPFDDRAVAREILQFAQKKAMI